MSAAARISQADMERMAKAVKRAGLRGRLIADFQNRRIEFIIGESDEREPSHNPWDDDDEA